MRGVMFHGGERVETAILDDPTPGSGEVVIQVTASGMCGSDLHAYRGPALADPVLAGHEPAGVVVDVGAGVPAERIGLRVMVHHYLGCSDCDQCRSGWTQLCRRGARAMGATAPGSHAEYVAVPAHAVMRTPDGLSDLSAAAISCGTGTAWSALGRLGLNGADRLAVFGQGPVGLSATQLAVAMGAEVIAVDVSESRLERARTLGASATVNPTKVSSVNEAIRELTGGRGVSTSLETSGASSAATEVLTVLDTWGRACWVGVGASVAFDVTDHLYRQITATTSWTMSKAGMEDCARFVVGRGVDVDGLFSDRWRLEDAAMAYQHLARQASGKGVFLPGGDTA